MIIIITIVICVFFLYLFYHSNSDRRIIPQGLKELPTKKGFLLTGNLLELRTNLMFHFTKLSQKLGPIYMIKCGFKDIVVLNNLDTIKKSLKENNDAFIGREPVRWMLIISQNSGILFTEGERWAKQRAFLQAAYRDFGLGKAKCFQNVQNECQFLIEELTKSEGTSVDCPSTIQLYTANIISKFIMNKRFLRSDTKMRYVDELVREMARKNDYVSWLMILFPVLNNLIWFNKLIIKITARGKLFEKIYSTFLEEIEDHRRRLDLNSEGGDFIDKFLIKQHEEKEKTGNVEFFNDHQLIQSSLELYITGSETISTTLVWNFLFLSKFPDVQEKAYSEIIDKIGNERMPIMNDKKDLNYCLAIMDETLRLASIINLDIRKTTTDTSINGYFIPQSTMIFVNFLACHVDPNIWENPWEFRPERFLKVDDNVKLKYAPREELIAFSFGKRQCLGESLGRMECFIFLISILQKFRVSFSKNITEKEYEETLVGNDGIVRFSKIKDFIFSSR